MIRKRDFGSVIGVVVIFVALTSPVVAEEVVEEDPLQAGMAAINAGDLIGAVDSLRKAADQGSAEAQAWLGYIYDYSEDDEEAVAYYRAAADQGHVRGIVGLAEMYSKGEGVEKDTDEGRKYYIKAAEMGDAGSIRVLIRAYEQGGLGVETDVGEAEYWKSRLAELEENQE